MRSPLSQAIASVGTFWAVLLKVKCCVEALTCQLLLCGAHATNFPVKDSSNRKHKMSQIGVLD